MHDDEDHPTPPVTPVTWGVSPSSAGLQQAVRAQPPSPPRRGSAAASKSDKALEGRVGGHQDNPSETYGRAGNAASRAGLASDEGGDGSATGGEVSDWKERSLEGPWAATVPMSQTSRNDTCTDNSVARSRQHRAAAAIAEVPGSSLGLGRLREDKVRAEMEDFFQEDDGDRHDRSSRAKSHEVTGGAKLEGGVSPLNVNMLAEEGKESWDPPKHFEGVYPGTVSSGEVGATETRNEGACPSVLLSEELRNFLYSDDDGDDKSAAPRRRMVSDASNQSDRSTRGVPACITTQRFDYDGAEANVEREEHDLEQQRTTRREVFDSFLFSDDESDILPSGKVCPAEYTGDGDGRGGIGDAESCIPERRRTRGLDEHGKEIDKTLGNTFSVDKRGSGERSRGTPGSDSTDTHANLERGTHPRAEQRAVTREENTISPQIPDSVDNASQQSLRAAVEASDARGSVGGVSGSNDGGGGTSPTSVAASTFTTEQAPVSSDGALRGRPDPVAGTRRAAWNAGGVSSHLDPITAGGQAAAENNPASIVTPCIPPCGVDENTRSTPSSSWSPAGLVSPAERAVTSGMDTPPVDQDGEREERAPWTPPTTPTTGKTIPPRGRTGWNPAATRQYWKARKNDNKNGSKEVDVTSFQDTYSTGGENSHWEVSKICV